MDVTVVDHPLIGHKVTLLRTADTDSATFARLADELVTLLAYEATRDIRVEPVTVRTPLADAQGVHLARPRPLIVPILRAGLGMLHGMRTLLPSAEVGFIGAVRDEDTQVVTTYGDRIPEELTGRQVYVLDPMLATGNTMVEVLAHLTERGATERPGLNGVRRRSCGAGPRRPGQRTPDRPRGGPGCGCRR